MKMTRRTAVQILAVALAALPLTGCSYNKFVGSGRSDQGAVGAGREPAAAPQRSHPEPGRNDQGIRAARGKRLQRHRRRAVAAARGEVARRDDRGRQSADVGARPPAGGRGELPTAQGQRAVQPADGRARRHREPACRPNACATTSASRNTTRHGGSSPRTSPQKCSASRNTRSSRRRPTPRRCRK